MKKKNPTPNSYHPEGALMSIPTPEKFANSKRGLVNIKNEDNECFKWCVKYHQSQKKNIVTEFQF